MNAIIDGGVGRISVAINGMMTTAAITTVCTTIERGTVYHWLLPTLMDDSTTSPNILSARGTGVLLLRCIQRASTSGRL
jgi:hypothetical protein